MLLLQYCSKLGSKSTSYRITEILKEIKITNSIYGLFPTDTIKFLLQVINVTPQVSRINPGMVKKISKVKLNSWFGKNRVKFNAVIRIAQLVLYV